MHDILASVPDKLRGISFHSVMMVRRRRYHMRHMAMLSVRSSYHKITILANLPSWLNKLARWILVGFDNALLHPAHTLQSLLMLGQSAWAERLVLKWLIILIIDSIITIYHTTIASCAIVGLESVRLGIKWLNIERGSCEWAVFLMMPSVNLVMMVITKAWKLEIRSSSMLELRRRILMIYLVWVGKSHVIVIIKHWEILILVHIEICL